jgi:PBSX family phage terminase large subunit
MPEQKFKAPPEGEGPAYLFSHQLRAMASDKKIVALVGGTGSGKTHMAPYLIFTKWLAKSNVQCLAIGLGYNRHVLRIMIKRCEEFLHAYKIPYVMNLSSATLTLKTNNSQVLFGSSENPMSLEGSHLEGGCWIDEAGQMSRLAFQVAERRTALKNAPILLTTVPYFNNYLKTEIYDPYLAGTRTDVEWIHVRSLDNLEFDPKVVEEIKARRRPEYFEIFYEGNFARPYGLIYSDPPSSDIIVDPEKEFPRGLPGHWPAFSGHDFGMNDPNAAVFARLDPNTDTLYVIAEYEAPSLTMRAHIERWQRAGLIVDAAFGDPSGADQMATAEELGYPIQKANNDILAGIDLVYDRFKTGRLRVFPNCKALIDYREQYVWAKNANDEDELLDKPANPQPARHMMDALRYLVAGLQENFMTMDDRGPVVSVRRRMIQTNYE